jgi:hypothetical protein
LLNLAINSLSIMCRPKPSHKATFEPSAFLCIVVRSNLVNKSANSLLASTCSVKYSASIKS